MKANLSLEYSKVERRENGRKDIPEDPKDGGSKEIEKVEQEILVLEGEIKRIRVIKQANGAE